MRVMCINDRGGGGRGGEEEREGGGKGRERESGRESIDKGDPLSIFNRK